MPKSPGEFLEEYAPEWFEAVNAKPDEEIRAEVSKVAFDEAANQEAKEADEDLSDLKEQVKLASEPYLQRTKLNKMKVKYSKKLLESRGKVA